MDSKPNVINAYLELYLTIFFFLIKCFLKCHKLINDPSVSKGLTREIHAEMFHKYV